MIGKRSFLPFLYYAFNDMYKMLILYCINFHLLFTEYSLTNGTDSVRIYRIQWNKYVIYSMRYIRRYLLENT